MNNSQSEPLDCNLSTKSPLIPNNYNWQMPSNSSSDLGLTVNFSNLFTPSNHSNQSNHQPQLSINSINSVQSIIEPVTPPSGNHRRSSSLGPEIDKEFLSSVNKAPLSQLKLDILRLSKDQYGCRFLQKKIDENLVPNYSVRFSNFEIIFNEIYLNLYELIIDPFGNYLIQKLIKYCSTENLNLMLEILKSNLFQISINQHGTRALQKIIENLTSDYQLDLLVGGLKPFIIELIKDLNGNHVIQKILNKFKPIQCQFIYDSILGDLITVATHKHGCCVLQKCLNHVTAKQLNGFVNEILSDRNFNKLINDQFGNYVLQYLISINNYQIHYKFYSNLVSFDLSRYCNLKFSSNVIEKFIKNCYNNEISNNGPNVNFIDLKFELIHQILNNTQNLNKLINDPFGNYVIQTLIDHLVNPQVQYSKLSLKNLTVLLLNNPTPESHDQIKFDVVNIYFQNCKIISSFGKRIQLKVTMILNNHNLSNGQSHQNYQFASRGSISNSMITPSTSINHLNMNVNQNPNVQSFMNHPSQISPDGLTSMPGSYSATSNGNGYFNYSNSNSLSSRSNSYPSIHSRSNSFQASANSNYVLDNQLQNNFNNLKLSNNYYAPNYQPVNVVQQNATVLQSQQYNGGAYGGLQFSAGSNPTANASYLGPVTADTRGNGPQPLNNTTNNFLNNGNTLGNMNSNNMNQTYLKTPQIFSNAPVNDYIHESNQNYNYYG